MDSLSNMDPNWFWLSAGVLMAAAEIIAPGFFLMWLGVAAILTAELVRDREECAVQRGAVVVGQVDEPGLHDEPAEFDELLRDPHT